MTPEKLMFTWFTIFLNTFLVPTVLVVLYMTSSVVPFGPAVGPFIIAAGALSIVVSFPFVARFNEILMDIKTSVQHTKSLDEAALRKLRGQMFINAAVAELPSILGMVYYLATKEIIGSLVICIPTIVLALTYRPDLPSYQALPQFK